MTHCLIRKVNIVVKIVVIFLLVMILESQTNNVILNAQNSNLNKQVDVKSLAILDIAQASEEERSFAQALNEQITTENIIEEEKPIESYTSKLTGYVYNCPKCSGRLACDSSIDLSKGNITYDDASYGKVRIVASSKNLKCGSIVSINASKISNEPIIAIVLDRGMTGHKLDLLMPSDAAARKYVGNTPITYDVLRDGY